MPAGSVISDTERLAFLSQLVECTFALGEAAFIAKDICKVQTAMTSRGMTLDVLLLDQFDDVLERNVQELRCLSRRQSDSWCVVDNECAQQDCNRVDFTSGFQRPNFGEKGGHKLSVSTRSVDQRALKWDRERTAIQLTPHHLIRSHRSFDRNDTHHVRSRELFDLHQEQRLKLIKAPPPTDTPITDEDVRNALARGRLRKRAKVHAFTLRCLLPTDDANPEDYVEALGTAGCTDATIGVGQRGRIALAFEREASSYAAAVSSAKLQVAAAIPGMRQIEVVSTDGP